MKEGMDVSLMTQPTEPSQRPQACNAAVCFVLAAVMVCILCPCSRARGDGLPAPLAALAARIEQDPLAPPWKKELAARVRARTIGRFDAMVTIYCPNNSIDPLGGGAWAAWGGLRLRRGHCAVGTTVRAAPYGTVLYVPGVVDHLQIVTDCGPGVNGSDRLDICEPDPERYIALDRCNWRRHTAWRLTRLTLDQVRAMG
jgi:hypothetical protein